MASNYYAYHPERKVTAGKPPKAKAAGSTPAINVKAGPFPGLPGKAQKDRSLGVKRVKIYNRCEGV